MTGFTHINKLTKRLSSSAALVKKTAINEVDSASVF